ncbi:hypothetical protein HU175_09180 [Spirosoma sp. KUDC1026]|nr:hypothetical protein HU175_09180 [Spirosoma sp. KUDC1026]
MAFDTQLNYRRDLEESSFLRNTVSNGTVQERAAMTLELRDTQYERYQQLVSERKSSGKSKPRQLS